MANKNINVMLKLTDKFTKPLMKATNATKAQEKAIRSAQKDVVKFVNSANNKFLSLTRSLGRVALGFTGIAGAISLVGMKQFANESIELAQAQIEAETKLGNALSHVDAIASGGKKSVMQAKKELVGYAGELQKVGVIGDEVTIAGMQQLATYGMNTKQIKALSKGMDDMLVKRYGLNATQENSVAVAKVLGKAMEGQYTALSKFGIVLSDAEKTQLNMLSDAERAEALAGMIEKRVGGINAEMANTDQGKIQQFQNAYGDMLESIGMKLLPIKAQLASIGTNILPTVQKYAEKALDILSKKIEQLVAWFNANKTQIMASLASFKNAVVAIWKGAIQPLIQFVMTHGKLIVGIIAAVGAAFTALNIVLKVMSIVQAVQKVINIIKTAKMIFQVASLATLGPIGLIVAAIAGIIAIGIAVYKNWDTIKAKALELKDKVVAVAQNIRDRFAAAFDSVTSKVTAIIDKIKSAIDWVNKLSDGIRTASGGGVTPLGGTGLHEATGTNYFRGGLTHINEGGRGEIVNLPSGTQVIPHDVAKKAVGGNTNINVNLNISGNVIGNKAFMEECGNYIAGRINVAMGVI